MTQVRLLAGRDGGLGDAPQSLKQRALADINRRFELMHSGESIRSVVEF